MALDKLACNVGDDSCKFGFDPGMDVKESSHTGGAASELFRGFTLLALTLCCDITNILVVGFLSEPSKKSALIGSRSQKARNLTFGRYGRHKGRLAQIEVSIIM